MRSSHAVVVVLAISSVARAQDVVAGAASSPSTIVVSAVAGSLRVVLIPIPADLSRAAGVTLSVTPSAGFAVVGASTRALRSGSTDALVTLSVAASARAGLRRAAAARFTSADGGGRVRNVFVDANIAWRRAMAIRVDSRKLGVLRGDRLALSYRVINTGNAADTAQLHLMLPNGWRADEMQGTIALDAGDAADHTARIIVSSGSATGSSVVRLFAIAGSDTVASADATVEVGDPDRRSRTAGPMLTLASIAVGDGRTIGGTAHTLSIDGAVSDKLRVSGRGTIVPPSGAQPLALWRMGGGYSRRTPDMTLSSDAWRLQLGVASLTLPDLAGVMVAGTGASFEQTTGKVRVGTIVARPDALSGSSRGEFLAARVGADVRAGTTVSISASHLADDRFGSNDLDAIVGDVRLPIGFGATVNSELAHRRYQGMQGIGWQTEVRRDAPNGTYAIRFASAPGGTAAFARAREDFAASASRSIGSKFSIAASTWRSRDSSASWRDFVTRGWTFTPALHVSRSMDLSLDGRGSSFAAEGVSGRMGTDESSLGLRAEIRGGSLYASGSATSGVIRREAAANDVRFDNNVARSTGRAAAGVVSLLGRLEVNVAGERTGFGAGLPVRQLMYGGTLADVRLIPWSRVLTARVDAQRFSWFGDRAGLFTVRTGVQANVLRSMRIALEAERNPFLSFLTPESGKWLFGVRVETNVSLPRLRGAADEGTVYRDVNANGLRDDGEPGVGGVLLRRQGETAITTSDGHFEFSGTTQLPIDVDTRSLPSGLVPPPVAAHERLREIGLLFISAARVQLAVADDQGRIGAEQLAKVSVIARDAAGRAWMARKTDADARVFDALPPGTYAIEVDASESSEPLRPTGELPVIHVVDGKNPPVCTVTLHPRTLKIRVMLKDSQ